MISGGKIRTDCVSSADQKLWDDLNGITRDTKALEKSCDKGSGDNFVGTDKMVTRFSRQFKSLPKINTNVILMEMEISNPAAFTEAMDRLIEAVVMHGKTKS